MAGSYYWNETSQCCYFELCSNRILCIEVWKELSYNAFLSSAGRSVRLWQRKKIKHMGPHSERFALTLLSFSALGYCTALNSSHALSIHLWQEQNTDSQNLSRVDLGWQKPNKSNLYNTYYIIIPWECWYLPASKGTVTAFPLFPAFSFLPSAIDPWGFLTLAWEPV